MSNHMCKSKSGKTVSGNVLKCKGRAGHMGRHFVEESMTRTMTWEADGDTPSPNRVNSDPNYSAIKPATSPSTGGVVYASDIYNIYRGSSSTVTSFKELFSSTYSWEKVLSDSSAVSEKDSKAVEEANQRATEAEKAAEDVKNAHATDVGILIRERDKVQDALEKLITGLGEHHPGVDIDPETGETECEECWATWPCPTSILIEEATQAWDR